MNSCTQTTDRLQDIYLTGVKPNGRDIGVGAYGRVYEVEYCGTTCAAKEVHSILVGVGEQFDAIKEAFLTECVRSSFSQSSKYCSFLRSIQSWRPVFITCSGNGADAGEPYISGGKLPKHSNVYKVGYVIRCNPEALWYLPLSSPSHHS